MMHVTEVNSRLTKDILSKNRECQDMHVQLFEATVHNSRLMDQLSQLAIENQQLRLQALAIQEENEELHSQLAHTSYKLNNGNFPVCGRLFYAQNDEEDKTTGDIESPENSSESWEEISQKLLNQMKQEMKEMEDLGQRLEAENNTTIECAYCVGEPNSKTASEELNASLSDVDLERVKNSIQSLKGQSEHLKGQLMTQRTVLQNVLKQLKKVVKAGTVIVTEKPSSGSSSSDISKNKFDRPSDELFRAYFTQQLHNSSGPQQCHRSAEMDEKNVSESMRETTFEQKSTTSIREQSPEDKICPMCQASFPYETPLDEFQNHVMDHFESENSTLMQQFELL